MDYTYTYNITTTSSDLSTGVIVGMVIMYIVMIAAFYVLSAIFMGKLFRKAGVPFWKAWVPIYNMVKFLQIGGQNPLYILFALIPFVGEIILVVFMCIAAYNIGKKLNKSDAFVVLYVFLSIVWTGICGLDKSTWDESQGQPSLAPETKAKSAGPVPVQPVQSVQ